MVAKLGEMIVLTVYFKLALVTEYVLSSIHLLTEVQLLYKEAGCHDYGLQLDETDHLKLLIKAVLLA